MARFWLKWPGPDDPGERKWLTMILSTDRLRQYCAQQPHEAPVLCALLHVLLWASPHEMGWRAVHLSYHARAHRISDGIHRRLQGALARAGAGIRRPGGCGEKRGMIPIWLGLSEGLRAGDHLAHFPLRQSLPELPEMRILRSDPEALMGRDRLAAFRAFIVALTRPGVGP